MSNIPLNGQPPYYGYPVPAAAGSYTYVPVPAPVMMPVYHPPPPHHPPPHYPPPHQPPPPPEPTPQPTYVTNYIYQQSPQPEPVRVVEEPPPLNLPRPWQAIAEIAGTCLTEVNNKLKNDQPTVCTHVYNPDVVTPDWVPSTPSSAASLTGRAFVAGKEGWDGSPLWVIRAHHSGEFIPGKLAIKHRAAYIPHGGRELPVHNFEVLCAPQQALRWLPASNGQVPVGAIPAGNTHNAEPLYIARVRHLRSITPGKVHPSHGTAYISFGGTEIPYKNYEVLCKIVG